MSNELALTHETIELLRSSIRGDLAEAHVCHARGDRPGFVKAFDRADASLARLGELLELRDHLELQGDVHRMEAERQRPVHRR